MPIPKSDREVLLDVPQWLLKRMVKVDPSPVIGGDGEGVYYIGRFSDTWADPDQRGKDFYYAHAKVILSPGSANTLSSKAVTALGDPPFASFASALCAIFLLNFCGPQSTSYTWNNCLDPAFEGTGTGCYPSGTVSSYSFSQCYTTYAAPSMFIFSGAPSSESDMTYLTAYSKPCPVASSAPSLSVNQTSGNVLIRAVGCDDPSNKVRYVRYTSEDKSSASYNIAYIGMGSITGTSSIYTSIRYGLTSSVTKGSTDYYYYIYTIGFQYQ